MRVAIVTTEQANNYGGTLQAFALQEVLRNLGHDPITIDYVLYCPGFKRYLLAQCKTGVYKLLGKRGRRFQPYPTPIRRNDKFDAFNKKHIKLSYPTLNYTQRCLKRIHPDAIIVGSDQVWRKQYDIRERVKDCFLRFAHGWNIPKIAYAASFGIDYWDYPEDYTKECAFYAKDFNAISVREESGIELCKRFLGVNAVQMPDPTLLLHRDAYLKIIGKNDNNEEPYLAAYILDVDERSIRLLEDYADKLGLRLKIVMSEDSASLGVEEWLKTIANASFVVTDSFHGTVFSIIFNKEFFSVSNESRGKARFESLLNQFGLENRIVSDVTSIPQVAEFINWNDVNSKKNDLSNKGIQFLKDNLKETK